MSDANLLAYSEKKIMLSDQEKLLLTAFVDGELSQRQRKAVMRLLQKSSDARAILKQLQENAHRLKELPRHKVDPSLVDEILKAIAEQHANVKKNAPARMPRRRWLPYVAASLAASLLVGGIGLLYWKSMIEPNEPIRNNDFVRNGGREKKVELKPAPPPEPKPGPTPTPKNKHNPLYPLLDEMTIESVRAFGAPVKPDQVFTARFQEFGAPAVRDRFSSELDRKKTIQLDVTVKNNSVAMERLKAALNERGVRIESDPTATKDLKANAKREYWVLAENLSTDELTKMMQDLAMADTTGQGASVPSPYDKVKLTPITDQETKKIAGLLGVTGDPVAVAKDMKVNNTKPKRWERMAVVLPTTASGAPSAEMRRFVAERQRPTPGAVQVLIKIHQQ